MILAPTDAGLGSAVVTDTRLPQVVRQLDGVTFLVFGAVLLGPAFKHLSWQIALYAVLSLTVVRMVPVAGRV